MLSAHPFSPHGGRRAGSLLVVLVHVHLIAGEHDGALGIEVDHRAGEPRRVAGEPDELQIGEALLAVAMEHLPVQVVVEVVEHVRGAPLVGLRAVVGELQLLLVDVHGRVGAREELQPAGVVEVEVALEHRVDVVERVARRLQVVVEAVVARVVRVKACTSPSGQWPSAAS